MEDVLLERRDEESLECLLSDISYLIGGARSVAATRDTASPSLSRT
jgi:hypothetical protein